LKRTVKEQKPKGYWRDKENRRKFFTELAAELGFDPKSTTDWQHITTQQVLAKNVS